MVLRTSGEAPDGGWGCRGGVGVQGWGGVGSGRVVLIDNGRVYQSKAADALVQVKPPNLVQM